MARTDWNRPSEYSAKEGRRRIAIEVAYDGRDYCGWQSQDSNVTVQQTILDAVKKMTNQENVEVQGSGRTDSGVHAFGQVAHIELDDCQIPAKAFCQGLNAFLPYSIRIKNSWDVPSSFHARYSSMAREYRYFCVQEGSYNAFTKGLVTNFRRLPDINLLNEYASIIKGTHDFTTFACAKDICPSKFRDIYESEFFYTTSMYNQNLLCYKITGNAFLYHMVRSLVGSMIEFALQKKTKEEFKNALDSKDRSRCGKTAPSDGLYLWRVSYDPDEYSWFEKENGK